MKIVRLSKKQLETRDVVFNETQEPVNLKNFEISWRLFVIILSAICYSAAIGKRTTFEQQKSILGSIKKFSMMYNFVYLPLGRRNNNNQIELTWSNQDEKNCGKFLEESTFHRGWTPPPPRVL